MATHGSTRTEIDHMVATVLLPAWKGIDHMMTLGSATLAWMRLWGRMRAPLMKISGMTCTSSPSTEMPSTRAHTPV
eukprot:scaffold34882_cov152-Isochrysis_galbana.AAC.1